MAHASQSIEGQREKVRSMINRIGTGMMTTLAPGGTFHARPMHTADVDEGFDRLWFATGRDSAKTDELVHDSRVGLTYANGKDWVSLSGHAHLVDDRDKARELWRDTWNNWFDGPDDPELLLIEVTPEIAEYWDQDNRAVVMAKLATAAVTGKHYDLGENKKVEFGD